MLIVSLARGCTVVRAAAFWCTVAACLPAAAASPIDFFGTFMNVNPPASPAPPCGAQIVNKNDPPTFKAAGFSNLGDFSFHLVQCLAPAPSGSIKLDFGAGNTLFGTWASVNTPSSTPLVAQLVGSADFVGGTGSFAGYTGSFTALGYLDRRDSAVAGPDFAAGSAFVFRGQVTPVPEPSAHVMWLAGPAAMAFFGARRRRRV